MRSRGSKRPRARWRFTYCSPPPLVERRLRVEVDERVNAEGGIDHPLNEASVELQSFNCRRIGGVVGLIGFVLRIDDRFDRLHVFLPRCDARRELIA